MPIARNHFQQKFEPVKFQTDYSVREVNERARKTGEANYQNQEFPVKRCPECKRASEKFKPFGSNTKPGLIYSNHNFVNITLREEVCPECK